MQMFFGIASIHGRRIWCEAALMMNAALEVTLLLHPLLLRRYCEREGPKAPTRPWIRIGAPRARSAPVGFGGAAPTSGIWPLSKPVTMTEPHYG